MFIHVWTASAIHGKYFIPRNNLIGCTYLHRKIDADQSSLKLQLSSIRSAKEKNRKKIFNFLIYMEMFSNHVSTKESTDKM